MSLDEWNGKSTKENGQDAVDGMKQEVYFEDKLMHIGISKLHLPYSIWHVLLILLQIYILYFKWFLF